MDDGIVDRSQAIRLFAGRLAHELSRPVQNIANAAELCVREDADAEMRQACRRIIEQEILSLTALLGELRALGQYAGNPADRFGHWFSDNEG
jgi:signal transduction histidine kinase